MHTRSLQLRDGRSLVVRPLRNGDLATVAAVFARVGPDSRRARFNGPKPCLSDADLAGLAKADSRHHALVAWVESDPSPAALAQLARLDRDVAEVAFVVADAYQQRGIGSSLTRMLLDDARAAGITEVTAIAGGENRAALALLRRAARVLDVRLEGPEQVIRAAVA
jgi:ribosomal protein S18 acetylase RimI-like enzyme